MADLEGIVKKANDIFKKYGFNFSKKDLLKAMRRVYEKERSIWVKPNFSYSKEILSEVGVAINAKLAKQMERHYIKLL